MEKLKAFLSGKKVYILMIVGAIVAVVQVLVGVSFGIPELPPATTVGELLNQLWAFAVASGFRAAIAK